MKFISSLVTVITLFQHTSALAHEGHGHSSTPAASSTTKFGSAVDNESPLSVSFKIRSGNEFGQFIGVLPSLNSYFGNDEINLNLNYEFQFRQFSSEQESEYEDRDFNNHFSTRLKKTITNRLDFIISGEYGMSQAVRIARMLNDYNYTAVNSTFAYKLENEWTVSAGYLFSLRRFPNGTYMIPSSSPSGVGEPIVPGEQSPLSEPITLEGVTDNQNEMTLVSTGEAGNQTLILEGKYILNDSDLATRRYNAQAFKVALEKMLWGRIFGQISYSIENRIFSDRSDKINTTELGLQKDLSAKMSVLAIARNNQTESIDNNSLWEGYAQLQYAF